MLKKHSFGSVLFVCSAIIVYCNATCLVQDPPTEGENEELFCTLDGTAVSPEVRYTIIFK
jgi:hypothetical protein